MNANDLLNKLRHRVHDHGCAVTLSRPDFIRLYELAGGQGHAPEIKHTPTPWTSDSTIYEHMHAEIRGERGIAQVWKGPNAAADTDFIIRACNNHDALVEALKAMIYQHSCVADTDPDDKDDLDHDAERMARAALAAVGVKVGE